MKLSFLISLSRSQLQDIYEGKYNISAYDKDYNTLLAAVYLNKRIKHTTKEEIKMVREKSRK